MNKVLLSVLAFCLSTNVFAQDYNERTWGVEATIGGGSFHENKTLLNEDQYNTFAVNANYYLTPRFALMGGLYLEQDGLMTDMAHGKGMKKFYMFGPEVGCKFYVFPKKWIIQPHIGAMLMTNVLNLGSNKGMFNYESNNIDCSKALVSYDVQCPVATMAPTIGVDLRLTSNITLFANMDYRIGLYGHNRSTAQVLAGSHAGKTYNVDESMVRNGFSVGLKVDLPWNKKDNPKVVNGLFNLIHMWISSKANVDR